MPVRDCTARRLPVYADTRFPRALAAAQRAVAPFALGGQPTRPPLEGVSLLIHEDSDPKEPEDGVLDRRLPVVGQTIGMPFRPTGVGQR